MKHSNRRPFDWSQFAAQLVRRIEGAWELVAIGIFVVVLVVIAAMLTPLVVHLVAKSPQLMTGLANLLALAFAQPWQHWVAFPFVLTVVAIGGWYLLEKEARKDGRPIRGRTVLSSEEARKAALRQLHRPDPKRRYLKKS